jgi:RNA polymerase sigma factor (sigma-70 family)
MAKAHLKLVVRHLRRMIDAQTLAETTDGQLVQRFTRSRDEAAFAALLRRHGPMVLGVCRGVLRQVEDAEDVFQATFLLLARKAGSIRKRESVGSWLHGVAYRLAVRARAQGALRRVQERKASAMRKTSPSVEEAWEELRPVLDEEMEKLPEKYRTALVLCYLEGKTQEEAARELSCPLGTVRSRLGRGRRLLQERLARRGLTLSASSFAALLVAGMASPVRANLLHCTLEAGLQFAAGKPAAGVVSGPVAALVEAGLKAMLATKLKMTTAVLIAVSLLTAGGALAHHVLQASRPGAKQEDRPQPVAQGTDRQEPAAQKHVRTDRYGDSLPPGAVARIGTVRWWHGHDRQGCPMVYTPDGKRLVSCDQNKGIRILDTATGKELRRIEFQGESISCFALSPDGKTIITGSWSSPVLRQWDISTGKELRQIPTGAKDTSVLAIAPDGKTLAAVTEQTVIRLWDVATWQETHQLKGHTRWIGSVVFSPDGNTLVSGGGITDTMRWWNVGTGREIKRLNTKSEHYWELALSPDGKRLAAIMSPSMLHLWDATTGDEIGRTTLDEKGSWCCLCFSPNSKVLACGDGLGRRGNQTLFFAAATGRELRRWDEIGYTIRMSYSPDGKILAQAQDGLVRLRDATTGKPVQELPIPNSIMSVRFTPDERTLLASCWGGRTGTWKSLTGEQRSTLKGPPEGFAGRADMLLGTALSTDGKRAALVDARGVLHVWDPATAKVWCRISEPLVGEDQADFSPDGNVLVVKHVDNVIRLWDTVTGKMRCSLPQFGTRKFPHPHAFSPDGRVLATAPSSQDKSVIRLWDTATGKELGKLAWQDTSSPTCLAFSPAGKYLVAAHDTWGKDTMVRPDDIGLRLWDLATGRELRRFNTPAGDIRAVVISPDGKTLAAGARDGTILLWELASGKVRGRFPGHQEWVWSLAFSPNGRLLASGSLDHTALVWDVTGISQDGKVLTHISREEEIERLWTQLGSADGIRAHRAMWMMVAASLPSVSFLAERLRPEGPAEDARLKRLIDELDSNEFKIRTRASQELEELGELAETALRKALAGNLSLEARRRAENLLHKVEAQILSPKRLLTLRALEVLEHIGTREATQVLQKLAKGAPEARLTQEAKTSLERLSR